MDGSPPAGFRHAPVWFAALAAVVVGQAGPALALFGPDDPLAGLTDARPVTSGRHPLHLYHGTLGATTFHERFSTSCYDPAFQAGYPKTPVFDGGCRPAEMFLIPAGRKATAATAYKLGLFAVCLFVPVAFAVAGRGMGLPPPSCCLAAVGGALVWWSPPVRATLEDGSVDLLMAALMALVFIGGLVRYATDPGVSGWVFLAASAAIGWYAHPIVWLGLVPVLGAYYVAQAPRHGPAWHLGIVGVTAAGLAPNLWWLWDWGKFWWLRQPSVDDFAPLPDWPRLVGATADYTGMAGCGVVGWAVFLLGILGIGALGRDGHRPAAGVLAATAGFAVVVARLGVTWPTLQVVAADRVAPFAVAVLVVPSAYLVGKWWAAAKAGRLATAAVVGGFVAFGWGPVPGRPAPLTLGFTPDQEDLVRALHDRTTPDARILIEDLDSARPGWNWTALLPTQTGRHFLGGLDPEACVEHAFCSLRADRLNGRPFADWTAAERAEFCHRYNVGWVVCRSPAAAAWWASDPAFARELGRYRDGGEVVLLELTRPRTFVRTGAATLDRIDRQKIVLSDAAPDPSTGELLLSLHHQPGFRVSPSVVRVDRDPDPHDPIPMLKLKLPGPMSRIVLTWENP